MPLSSLVDPEISGGTLRLFFDTNSEGFVIIWRLFANCYGRRHRQLCRFTISLEPKAYYKLQTDLVSCALFRKTFREYLVLYRLIGSLTSRPRSV